ncbi:hypothetical protein LCGC14_1852910, partial [marine sediment metagenome]
MPRDELIPTTDTIFAWVQEVFAQGVRRPGYPADRWAEQFCLDQFRTLGLENVRLEPVRLPYWEPRQWSLAVSAGGRKASIPCFPLPHSAPAQDLEAGLAVFNAGSPDDVRGRASLFDLPLMRQRHATLAALATWCYDPDGTFDQSVHVLPFGREIQAVMEPSIQAGAVAFIGVLSGYPGDSHDYYVPYDAFPRPLPGVWVNGSHGERLRSMLREGPVQVTLQVDSVREEITTHNVVGELPGADEEMVIIGSHHDGPWASAVEDASGISLVLAQAVYWSRLPPAERPHRLLFLLNSGHMAGGAGARSFIDRHQAALQRTVLEVHLEHAASEFVERDGAVVPSGHPEARWWFTSGIAPLQSAVRRAIEAEDMRRSLILPPTA